MITFLDLHKLNERVLIYTRRKLNNTTALLSLCPLKLKIRETRNGNCGTVFCHDRTSCFQRASLIDKPKKKFL